MEQQMKNLDTIPRDWTDWTFLLRFLTRVNQILVTSLNLQPAKLFSGLDPYYKIELARKSDFSFVHFLVNNEKFGIHTTVVLEEIF